MENLLVVLRWPCDNVKIKTFLMENSIVELYYLEFSALQIWEKTTYLMQYVLLFPII